MPAPTPQRCGNWTVNSSTPAAFYTATLHGEGMFARATDDFDWSAQGKEDTERMLVRMEINRALVSSEALLLKGASSLKRPLSETASVEEPLLV